MQEQQQPASKMWSGRFREPLDRTFEQWQRISGVTLLRALLLTATLAVTAHAQDTPPAKPQPATVTIYAHGSFWESGLPGNKHSMFVGSVFDGSTLLASFYEGFLPKNNRFVTVRLPAGAHDFVATDNRTPKSEVHIPVTLEAGKQYFFRAQDEAYGFVVVGWTKARLDQVTCAEAQSDAPGAKPLHPKHPPPALTASRVDLLTMPGCS